MLWVANTIGKKPYLATIINYLSLAWLQILLTF